MIMPARPKIYHILHVDRLPSIIADGCLWSDSVMATAGSKGTSIGMSAIKGRRLHELTLASHPGLYVGKCVPFYFCPRSVMLYLIYQGNHVDLAYRDGQGPIIHLQADLRASVAWAEDNNRRWAFTLSNAGAYYFEDRSDLEQLSEINWQAVAAVNWHDCKEGKQAEFLMEHSFPWHLIERVGVHSEAIRRQVLAALPGGQDQPEVVVRPDWYYR